jgi:hypothetical protein
MQCTSCGVWLKAAVKLPYFVVLVWTILCNGGCTAGDTKIASHLQGAAGCGAAGLRGGKNPDANPHGEGDQFINTYLPKSYLKLY